MKRHLDAGPKQKKVVRLRACTARSSSRSYIQILGTGMDTGDTLPSVLLFFDNKRYLFNAGEGLQRFCEDSNIKLSGLDHVLVTRLCSETAGGIAGALLTLAGAVGLTMNIWSPSDLGDLVAAWSTYIPNASMLYTHSFGRDGKLVAAADGKERDIAILVEDELVKISAVLLLPSNDQGEGLKAGDVAVTYICELPDVKGMFDPSKAAALGLRAGPKFGRLQNGCSVFSDDNRREIFPADVMEPPSAGSTFLLVDCPTPSHIPSLYTATGLQPFYEDEPGKTVTCVVHLAPAEVVEDPRYQSWMQKFGSSQTHILAGSGCSRLTSPVLKSSARLLVKLNVICPSVFPVTGFIPDQLRDINVHFNQPFTATVAENLLKFHLSPVSSRGLDKSSVPKKLDAKMVEEEIVKELPEITAQSEKLRQVWSSYQNRDSSTATGSSSSSLSQYTTDVPDALRGVGRNEMEIVFLGTGSSRPSSYRNTSSIYVHLFQRGGLLLDCGEGTYAQLIRRFGVEGAQTILENIKCVWISHIHADHHGGLSRLLSARRSLLVKHGRRLEPLLVVGPKKLQRVTDAYDKFEDLSMHFLDCSQTVMGAQVDDRLNSALEALQLESLVSVPVDHCPQAYGVVVQSPRGWKLAFSGDTRPSPEFNQASLGATVFIHEATFQSTELTDHAIKKRHSVSSEAIYAGVTEAQAYRVILTHFSQRYAKVPVFEKFHEKSCHRSGLFSSVCSRTMHQTQTTTSNLPSMSLFDQTIQDYGSSIEQIRNLFARICNFTSSGFDIPMCGRGR